MMYDADARIYELATPAWPARLLDFPLHVPVSYVWTGFWGTPDGQRAPGRPAVTIATANRSGTAMLLERLGFTHPLTVSTGHTVRFLGRPTVREQIFNSDGTGDALAVFEDEDTTVAVVARSLTALPPQITVRPMGDRDGLVEEWKALWGPYPTAKK
ncbi:hypothetical protein AB0E56_06870 [Microbacterium sp. NPDC028030]|uniref:hypothetical protein n=1 Tax=Microbacterium sp. NPDC028030 TaxID=3155124 RepID=UPI0033E85710